MWGEGRHKAKLYHLLSTADEAEGRLPFPDPQLSFAEMAELARCDSPPADGLAELLASVTRPAEPPIKRPTGRPESGLHLTVVSRPILAARSSGQRLERR